MRAYYSERQLPILLNHQLYTDYIYLPKCQAVLVGGEAEVRKQAEPWRGREMEGRRPLAKPWRDLNVFLYGFLMYLAKVKKTYVSFISLLLFFCVTIITLITFYSLE